MPSFSVRVRVDHGDDLRCAWIALAGQGLRPSIPFVPLEPGRDLGPLQVAVVADSEDLAWARVRTALTTALLPESFEVAREPFSPFHKSAGRGAVHAYPLDDQGAASTRTPGSDSGVSDRVAPMGGAAAPMAFGQDEAAALFG